VNTATSNASESNTAQAATPADMSTAEALGYRPTAVLDTQVAIKEKAKDPLQTLCTAPTEIVLLLRAKRLASPLSIEQTFLPLEQRQDLAPVTQGHFDEQMTAQLLTDYQTLEITEQSLRPGWLYLYRDGFLWREYRVDMNEEGELTEEQAVIFSEVTLHVQEGEDVRLPDPIKQNHLRIPVDADIEIAWSEVQWGWSRINDLGGLRPDKKAGWTHQQNADFAPKAPSPSNPENLSPADLRKKRCTQLSIANGNDDTQTCYSSETYQLHNDPEIPEWVTEHIPELLGPVTLTQPTKHIITVVLEDHLEVGRELANRYQDAVADLDNLIVELQNEANSGSMTEDSTSPVPLKMQYRFARWFHSAQLIYQQVFNAEESSSDSTSDLFKSRTALYGYRTKLDLKDIYIALGIFPRKLQRQYIDQCQQQLMCFLSGNPGESQYTDTHNNDTINTILIHLQDYQSLPALDNVLLNVDGDPLEPTNTDDLFYIAKLLNRIGEVPRMKDITIDGGRNAFLNANEEAQQHPVNKLLRQLSGEDTENRWFQHINDRKIQSPDDDAITADDVIQSIRRVTQAYASIVDNLLAPHMNPNGDQLLKTLKRLQQLCQFKMGVSLEIGELADFTGNLHDEKQSAIDPQKRGELLSRVINNIDYPEKIDTSAQQTQLKNIHTARKLKKEQVYRATSTKYQIYLTQQKNTADKAAKIAADTTKQHAMAKVTAAGDAVTHQQKIRNRLEQYHTKKQEQLTQKIQNADTHIETATQEIEQTSSQLDALDTQQIARERKIQGINMRIENIASDAHEDLQDINQKYDDAKQNRIELGGTTPSELENKHKETRKEIIDKRKRDLEAPGKELETLKQQQHDAADKVRALQGENGQNAEAIEKQTKEKEQLENEKIRREKAHQQTVDVHDKLEKDLKKERAASKRNQQTAAQTADQRLKRKQRERASLNKKALQTYDTNYNNQLKQDADTYKDNVKAIENKANADYTQLKAIHEQRVAEEGKRSLDPNNKQDQTLEKQLQRIKSGNSTIEQVIPTTKENYLQEKPKNSPTILVLTPDESTQWKTLQSQQVYGLKTVDINGKPTLERIISRGATESLLAHQQRMKLIGSVLLGFEVVTLARAITTLQKEKGTANEKGALLNVIGSIFDTGDAVASLMVEHQQLKIIREGMANRSLSATTASAAKHMSTITRIAFGASMVANAYSSVMAFNESQKLALKYDDAHIALKMQSAGFAITGVGVLAGLIFSGGGAAAGAIAAAAGIAAMLGIIVMAVGVLAYYFWFKEDLDVLAMWLKHGPFSLETSFWRGSIPIGQPAITEVTLPECNHNRRGATILNGRMDKHPRVPTVVFEHIGANKKVLKLVAGNSLGAAWIDPHSFTLIDVSTVSAINPHSPELADKKFSSFSYKTEGDKKIYHLGNIELGAVDEPIGRGKIKTGNENGLLVYLTHKHEVNPERFYEPNTSELAELAMLALRATPIGIALSLLPERNKSQYEKVAPIEWAEKEEGGHKSLMALKAGLFPANVTLQVGEKSAEIDYSNGLTAYGNAMGRPNYKGNQAKITVELPPDLPSDAVVTIWLMRVDDGVFGGDEFYRVVSIFFSINEIESKEFSEFITINNQGMTNEKRSLIINLDLDVLFENGDFYNEDKLGVRNGFYVHSVQNTQEITYEAWLSCSIANTEDTYDSLKPYRTESTQDELKREFEAWEISNKNKEFSTRARVGWQVSKQSNHKLNSS